MPILKSRTRHTFVRIIAALTAATQFSSIAVSSYDIGARKAALSEEHTLTAPSSVDSSILTVATELALADLRKTFLEQTDMEKGLKGEPSSLERLKNTN